MVSEMNFLPVSGSWSAVYANEGEDCSLRTEPVIAWTCKRDLCGVDVVVGVVAIGPTIVPATAPDLLGYAREGENISAKFSEALKAFKKEEATHAVALLAARLREARTGEGPCMRSFAKLTPGRITELANRAADAVCECQGSTLVYCDPCADGNHDFCLTACTVMPALDMCQRINKKN